MWPGSSPGEAPTAFRLLCPGLTRYSGDPRTERNLKSFGSQEQVQAAMRGLHYKSGNTFTGVAWQPPTFTPWGELCTPGLGGRAQGLW